MSSYNPLEQLYPPDNSSALEGLIDRSSAAHERTSLVPAIFSTPDVVEKVRGLNGDDAQVFIDVINQASSRSPRNGLIQFDSLLRFTN